MSTVQTERVLVVPTELFHQLGHFQGFRALDEAGHYLHELLSPEHVSYRPRSEMEEDPGFKQLIPYVVFRHRDRDDRQAVFQYTRGSGQGEGRLHSKRSVGIGGHISAEDAALGSSPYDEGMRRELEEEVAIDAPYQAPIVGLLNDDETEVGRVHLGIVHLADIERPAVTPREREILDAGFRPAEELLADLDRFESWSQICLQALFG